VQKFLKVTAGSLLAAALMVGCNMNNDVPKNESLMDDAVNDTENVIDRDRDLMDNNNGTMTNPNMGNDQDPLRNDNNVNDEDIIEDKVDREDRDKRDE